MDCKLDFVENQMTSEVILVEMIMDIVFKFMEVFQGFGMGNTRSQFNQQKKATMS